MKRILLSSTLLAFTVSLSAQTIWTGPVMTFNKAPNADFTLPVNQDLITPNVIITRGNTQGIFNIATETSYTDFTSPADTEWSFGTTANLGSLTFADWETAVGGNPPGSVGMDMVVHLITDDIYIDIKFTGWGQMQAGGGSVSYERSTQGSVSINELELPSITAFPNPSDGYFSLIFGAEISGSVDVEILDATGKLVRSEPSTSSTGQVIDFDLELNSGMYFVRVSNKKGIRTERIVIK